MSLNCFLLIMFQQEKNGSVGFQSSFFNKMSNEKVIKHCKRIFGMCQCQKLYQREKTSNYIQSHLAKLECWQNSILEMCYICTIGSAFGKLKPARAGWVSTRQASCIGSVWSNFYNKEGDDGGKMQWSNYVCKDREEELDLQARGDPRIAHVGVGTGQ